MNQGLLQVEVVKIMQGVEEEQLPPELVKLIQEAEVDLTEGML